MGATGTGKSKLSIELATVFDGEVVNSDKIQVYRGLDITTNKMPLVVAGGSNSFIHAAMAGRYDPRQSPFAAGWRRRTTRKEAGALRYRCCFLWVDVDAAALA
ncbi:hypothetical protein GW17_00046659, partial [Ensete ventricosum]